MRIISTLHRPIVYLFSLAVVILLSVLSGCGDSSASAIEVTSNQLKANQWRISSVMVDATDQTALFTNMTLSFTATDYTTTNGKAVWPATGTWSFTDNTAKKIKRSDNLEVTITEITDSTLKLSLTWATGTFGSGRTSSLAGNHTFSFVK
jgi:hypothetical protein